MTARERTRAVLGAIAAGVEYDRAMSLADGRALHPPVVTRLLEAAPAEKRVRVAELAIEAMAPSTDRSYVSVAAHPAALIASAVALGMTAQVTRAFVMPVFDKMRHDFAGGGGSESYFGVATILAVVAAVLGVAAARRASGGVGSTFVSLLFIGTAVRRRPVGHAVATALRWLAAAAAAGLEPGRVLLETASPLSGGVRKLHATMREATSVWPAVQQWAKEQPAPVRRVASGRIKDEEPASAVRRVAITAKATTAPDRGSGLAVAGYVILAVAVYAMIAPVMTEVFELASFVLGPGS